MKKKSALLALLLSSIMSFSVFGSACNVNPGGPGSNNKTETELTTDTAISLVAGQTCTLTASSGVTWASSDTNVATVNGSGVVSAKTKGVTKVTATKKGEKTTCTVIVLDAYESSSSGGTVKPPFTFNNDGIQIGSVTSSGSGPAVADPNAEEYIVMFSDANGAIPQNVAKGGLAVEPLVEKSGNYLKGWTAKGAETTYNDYDFSQPVDENLQITAVWGTNPSGFELVKGNTESIALEWAGSKKTVQYAVSGTSNWTTVDSELVREASGSVRADILGLKAGKYDVKVGDTSITGIPVKAYDRSGYAHFNYTSGVGAYKDDGTLKDGALVIYVTNDNKNDVLNYAYRNGEKIDISEYLVANTTSLGVTLGQQKGIGEILNNRRYSGNDRLGMGIAKLCDVYGAVAVRFIGTVENSTNYAKGSETYGKTEINGLTWYAKSGDETPYDSTKKYAKGVAVPNGGTVNDNGSMARITNAHDVTIEGVGDDAVIKGWGFHFVSSEQSGRSQKAGSSFEVRNITFNEYPEDAIGFEGEAQSKKITSPVQRCWVHNNTFLPGYCPSPAESDKGEGDGSCDFKRGYYFTAAYNYFEYCHKTNLIGSADDSLQFNLTYHHNIWYQCGSRIPLTRQANVHFYNNYVFGDPSQKTTPYKHISKPALSYVHSLRASCYLFSEANYYEGCKNLLRGASEGGNGKFFGNTYYACSDTKAPVTEADNRTQTVSNTCNDPTPGTGADYKTFDTNPNLFYYDSANKKTAPQSGILDDSLSARLRAIFYAGAQGHGEVTKKMQQMNTSEPVTDPSITKAIKGKGQLYTFSVSAKADLTIDATGEDPQIIRNDGKIYQAAFSGEVTVTLDPGTYIVCAGKKDKEITINSLRLEEDSEQAKANRMSEAERLISAIPDTIKWDSGAIIDQAAAAYKKLKAEDLAEFSADLTARLSKAQKAYEEISIAYVIARIEYIGTVTPDSKNDIEEATKAYAALSNAAKAGVTNYDDLTAATAAFVAFAIESIKFEIDRLPLSTSLTVLLDSKPAVELALELYNTALQTYNEYEPDDEVDNTGSVSKDDIDVTNVKAAIALLDEALNLIEFRELLADFADNPTITKDDKAQVNELKAAYAALTETQLNSLTEAEKAKYKAVTDAFAELFAGAQSCTFVDGKPSNEMFTSNTSGKRGENFDLPDGSGSVTSGMKVEGSTKLQFTTETEMTLTLYMSGRSAGKKITIDGTAYTITAKDGYNIVTITLAAGSHTIEKGSSNGGDIDLMYLTLE